VSVQTGMPARSTPRTGRRPGPGRPPRSAAHEQPAHTLSHPLANVGIPLRGTRARGSSSGIGTGSRHPGRWPHDAGLQPGCGTRRGSTCEAVAFAGAARRAATRLSGGSRSSRGPRRTAAASCGAAFDRRGPWVRKPVDQLRGADSQPPTQVGRGALGGVVTASCRSTGLAENQSAPRTARWNRHVRPTFPRSAPTAPSRERPGGGPCRVPSRPPAVSTLCVGHRKPAGIVGAVRSRGNDLGRRGAGGGRAVL